MELNPLAAGVHELMRSMIESNRQRDEQVNAMLLKISKHVQDQRGVSIVADLNQCVKEFSGDSVDCATAEEY